jgi:hydrogenase maturation factor
MLSIVAEIQQTLNDADGIDDSDAIHVVPVLTRMDRVLVHTGSAADFVKATEALAELSFVAMISRRMPVVVRNKWARGIMDSGLSTAADYASSESLVSYALCKTRC